MQLIRIMGNCLNKQRHILDITQASIKGFKMKSAMRRLTTNTTIDEPEIASLSPSKYRVMMIGTSKYC